MANKTISQLPEITTANNDDVLIIENSTSTNKITKANLLKDLSGGSISSDSIIIKSPNLSEYKITIDNYGAMKIDRVIPVIGSNYDGLIINQVYGGGIMADEGTSVTHSFIELYNTTDNTINLAGLSIHYSEGGTTWHSQPLSGSVPPKHSFLIRGARHSEDNAASVKIRLTEFDLEWQIPMYNKGMKVVLKEGSTAPTVANPYRDNEGKWIDGYVDMIGCGEVITSIDASEATPVIGQSKQKSVRRIGFKDTQFNELDCEVVDFRLDESAWKRPRSLAYGAWAGNGVQIPSAQEYADNLKILQVYGGGSSGSCSHHFVELYNNHATKSMPLDGISLFGATFKDPVWQHIPLVGVIPPKHSFLLRGTPGTGTWVVNIFKSDQDCSLKLDKGMKVFLISTKDPAYLTGIDNPFNHNGSKVAGYIDGFGCGGNSGNANNLSGTDGCTGYEGEPPIGGDAGTTLDSFGTGGNSKNNAMRRKTIADTDNNARDFEVVRYSNVSTEPDLLNKQPRWVEYGTWVPGENFNPPTGGGGSDNGGTEASSFKFIHVTDTQANTDPGFTTYKTALSTAVAHSAPNFMLHTGDMIDDTGSNANNWTWFMTRTAEVMGNIPWYGVRGNNDVNYTGKFTWKNVNVCPANSNAYFFEYGDAIFCCLDSEGVLSAQATWLDGILTNTTKKWKIIAIHRAPYTSIREEDIITNFLSVIDNHNVHLVLCGHKHMYMRSKKYKNNAENASGTTYMMGHPMGVTIGSLDALQDWMAVRFAPGTSCFNEVSIDTNNITVKACKINGDVVSIIDTYTL